MNLWPYPFLLGLLTAVAVTMGLRRTCFSIRQTGSGAVRKGPSDQIDRSVPVYTERLSVGKLTWTTRSVRGSVPTLERGNGRLTRMTQSVRDSIPTPERGNE